MTKPQPLTDEDRAAAECIVDRVAPFMKDQDKIGYAWLVESTLTGMFHERARAINILRTEMDKLRIDVLALQSELSEMATILKAEAIHAKRSKRGRD